MGKDLGKALGKDVGKALGKDLGKALAASTAWFMELWYNSSDGCNNP